MKEKKGFTFIELLIVVAIIFILFSIVSGGSGRGCIVGFKPDYSTGVREGYIVKFSDQKGIYFKTIEGQLQPGTGKQASLQEAWNFSVTDTKLASQINEALGKHVRLHYRQWLFPPITRMESSYEIVRLEILEKEEQK